MALPNFFAVAIVTPIMMFAVMFFVDWRLGILLVILTIISIACMFGMYGDMTFMEKYAKALEKMNSEAANMCVECK